MLVDRYLSPKKLAQAIGASESSLKRWADVGLIHVSKTAGGHRRIALREALRFIRESGSPVLDPGAIDLPEFTKSLNQKEVNGSEELLIKYLMEGDADEAGRMLLQRFLSGGEIAAFCDGPLRECMRRLGNLWRHGPEGIFLEHRTTDLCVRLLQFLRSILPSRNGQSPVALGGSPSGDPYLIPSLMSAVVCAAAGWKEINLGPNLPVAALVEAVRGHRPKLVWVSLSVKDAGEAFLREWEPLLEAVRNANGVLVLGGQALPVRSNWPDPAVPLANMEALSGFLRGYNLKMQKSPAAR